MGNGTECFKKKSTKKNQGKKKKNKYLKIYIFKCISYPQKIWAFEQYNSLLNLLLAFLLGSAANVGGEGVDGAVDGAVDASGG